MEDLQGGYAAPPNMDPEHEQRLKMLQLMQAAAATTSVPLAGAETGGAGDWPPWSPNFH